MSKIDSTNDGINVAHQFVNNGIVIPFDQVMFCTTSERGNTLNFKDDTVLYTDTSLRKLQQQFPSYFERIHHSYLVNINAIRDIHDNGETYVTLHNNVQIPVAQRRKKTLLKHYTKL